MRGACLTNQNVSTVFLEVVLTQITRIYKPYASLFALTVDIASRSYTTHYSPLGFDILNIDL